MSLRVGHQINYYSIPLQFYIIKRDKDNLNLSNTDSRLAEGKYDTALIKDEAKSSCKSSFYWILPFVDQRQRKARVVWGELECKDGYLERN